MGRQTTIIAALLASVTFAGVGQAASLAVLSGDSTIAIVDADGKTDARRLTLSGVSGRIAGIDVRPADGMLYALMDDGAVAALRRPSGHGDRRARSLPFTISSDDRRP